MECGLCTDKMDLEERRPKVLPCGHSACLQCLLKLEQKVCPLCKTAWKSVEALVDNYALVNLLSQSQRAPPTSPMMWCVDCGEAATRSCQDNHPVLNARAALRRQLQDSFPRATQDLKAVQKDIEALQQQGSQVLADDQVLAALKVLGRPADTCEVTLRRNRDETYTVKYQLDAKDALFRSLVLILATRGEQGASGGGDSGTEPTPQAQPTPGNRPNPNLPPGAEVAHITGLDISSFCQNIASKTKEIKDGFLERIQKRGVLLIRSLYCDYDPVWSAQLLCSAAPLLEELYLLNYGWDHLATVSSMPRLRRLHVYGDSPASEPSQQPFYSTALQFLRVVGQNRLPRETLAFLLQAFGAKLEQLVLTVGTPGDGNGSCDDLHLQLSRWNLKTLRRVVLLRSSLLHVDGFCRDQLEEVRRLLPRASVYCGTCHKVLDTNETADIKIAETL